MYLEYLNIILACHEAGPDKPAYLQTAERNSKLREVYRKGWPIHLPFNCLHDCFLQTAVQSVTGSKELLSL